MSLEIELPDGTLLDAPDDADPSAVAKAYLSKQKPAAPSAFAGDDLLSNQAMSNLGAGQKMAPSPVPPSMLKQYLSRVNAAAGQFNHAKPSGVLGPLDSITALISGAAAPTLGSIAGMTLGLGKSPQEQSQIAQRASEMATYHPRSAVGKAMLGGIGAVAQPVTDFAAETGADMALVPLAAESQALTSIARAPRQKPARTAQEVLTRLQMQDSVGAASAARGVSETSPPLQQAIVNAARKTGGAVNQEVLQRHMDADSLPVPVRILEGHATQDPMVISNEMNLRGSSKEMVDRMNEINQKLGENIKVMRDEVGPEVFSTNATEHGDTLIAAYQARDEAARADISAKYKALADANGGNLPVDGASFVKSAAEGLKKQMKAPFLPPPINTILSGLRKGEPMTIESFENLRTALAAEGRKADRAGDGNAAAAVHIVRDALESVPMEGSSAGMKQIADAARTAARQRFEAIKADPAYKAVVDDNISPDRFVQKFIIGAPRDQVAKLSEAMAGNDQALQTIQVSVLDHLRDQASLSPRYEGNFSSAGYNKALKQLDPKLRHLLPAPAIENVEKLGRVAGYTTAQPKGSFVNNSNSFVASAADYGAAAAEGAANVAAHGLPIGTWGRKMLTGAQRRGQVRDALAPGAGIGRLKETKEPKRGLLSFE